MRPIRLEMTAFGSYAEHTVVPFDAWKQGLYLVTGDTGAGKTTIFDGIVFALYGKASGKDRTPEMMHCDLVEKSVDTEVRLCFSRNGKQYVAVRRIHFPKKRKAEEGYGDPDVQALLTGEDIAPVEGATRVSAACEALLGLNAEQFRKIVMLAQGEFRDFLKSDSEKKNEILSKLFDSSAYLWYQRLLEGAWRRLEQQRQGRKEALKTLLETRLVLPAEENPADFLPDDPNLAAHLDRLLADGSSRAGLLQQRLSAAEQDRDALLTQKSRARDLNDALDRLERGRQRSRELAAGAPEIARRQRALDRAELALHRVMPALRDAERSAREREEAREALEQLKRQAACRAEEYRQALDQRRGDESLALRRDEIAGLLSDLDQQLGRFAALRKAEQDLAAAGSARAACRERQQAMDQQIAAQEARRRQDTERLAALTDADRLAAEALREAEEAGRVYTAIAGPGGLRARLSELREQERRLNDNDSQFRAFTARVLEARSSSDTLYRRFLAGQAGLLAEDLRRTVEAKGTGVCPVCGSALDAAGLCGLAARDAETPTQEAVEAARQNADQMEAQRQTKKEQLDKAHSQLLTRQAVLVSTAAPLCPGCDGWETLSAPGYLEQAEEAARLRSAAARTALETARSRLRERSALQEDLDRAEQSLAQLRSGQERLRAESAASEQAYGAAEHGAALLRSQLRFGSEAEARQAHQRLKQEQAVVCNLLAAHEAREKQSKEKLDLVEGQLRHAQATLEARTLAAEQAAAERQQRLQQTGFADAAAAAEALLPCRGLAPEDWLQAERQALADYEREQAALSQTLKLLEEQTAGQPRAELPALEAAFQAAEAACQDLRQQSRSLGQWLESCRDLRQQAVAHLEALEASAEAWQRLEKLGTLAVGSNGLGGKLSFERYVMGAAFREILEQANRRLDLISGGRYQLVHKSAADRASAKAGLEIEILDLATGKRRPSASLSGGEAFYTSLALALGLSDVVQSRAGGMKLEALFIDEGFGSLDDDMLDNALNVLNQLTEGDRLVGIISHVDKLSASIPRKLVVSNGPRGSSLRLVE